MAVKEKNTNEEPSADERHITDLAHSGHSAPAMRICLAQRLDHKFADQQSHYCDRYTNPQYSFPGLLSQVPGGSPFWASSIAKLLSGLPDLRDDLNERNEFRCEGWLNDAMCVFTKSLHARKNGGT